MERKGPGRSHRKGITVMELLEMFPDDMTAEKWFEEQRWPDGRFCPDCGSTDTVACRNRKPMPYRCRACRKHFSVKKGTVMQSAKVGMQKWAIALYMMTTGIKGTSSMKTYRELGVRQATAWFLMHRVREGFEMGTGHTLPGPVEVDESYFGGKRKNMSNSKRKRLKGTGRGPTGKTAVAAIKDRETDTIRTKVVKNVDKPTLQGFIRDNVEPDATVYTDDAKAYEGMNGYRHESVNHSVSQFVDDMAHVNGVESFWALFKRGYHGTFHHVSAKHLWRYAGEFAGRHNIRDLDTVVQMTALARGMVGKRIRYADLIADKGMPG